MNRKTALIIVVFLGVVLTVSFLVKNTQNQALVNNQISIQSESPDIPDDWNTYSSSLKYTIYYPKDYVIEPSGNYSILIFKLSDEPGAGPSNLIYISVVQPNLIDNEGDIYNYRPTWFNKLNNLEIGEGVSLADAEQPIFDQVMTYTRTDDAKIDGHVAKRFENHQPWEFPTGTTEVRYMFEKDRYIYILGYYYGGEGVPNPIDARDAFNIVSSFHLN